MTCKHVEHACKHARTLCLGPDIDDELPSAEFVLEMAKELDVLPDAEEEIDKAETARISSHPIPAIPWAAASKEKVVNQDIDYGRLGYLASRGENLCCRCSAKMLPPNTFKQCCMIHDINRSHQTEIALVQCLACDCFTGPDLATISLFNFDNATILTNWLLHKFDSYYTGQEGTFLAFRRLMSHEYSMKCVPTPFMPVNKFQSTWFAFVRLQGFSDNFKCPICKEILYCIVIDVVTISYQCRKKMSRLQPPTHIQSLAPRREFVRPTQGKYLPQLVADCTLRQKASKLGDEALGHVPQRMHNRRQTKAEEQQLQDWGLLELLGPRAVDSEERESGPAKWTQEACQDFNLRVRDVAELLRTDQEKRYNILALIFEDFLMEDGDRLAQSRTNWFLLSQVSSLSRIYSTS